MEKWKQIKGYEGLYEVSSTGLVKNNSGLILKYQVNRKGYFKMRLTKDKKTKGFFVHRLVANAFIKNLLNKPQINHINGDKKDNRVENLEWCTQSENKRHAFKIGLESNVGSKNPSAKVDEKKVLEIRDKRKMGYTTKQLCDEYGISPTRVRCIISRKNWNHI